MNHLDQAIERLRCTSEQLPDDLREQLVTAGSEAVPSLLAILEDRAGWQEDAAGDGWPPIHAATILGEIRDPRSVAPMIDCLHETDALDVLANALWLALPKHGVAALEPLLAVCDEIDDPHERLSFCIVLGELGVRDERIFERLLAMFEHNAEAIAGSFAEYGDPRALPILAQCLDEYELDERTASHDLTIKELAYAIEDLGGELTESQREKVATAHRIAAERRLAATRRQRRAPLDRPSPARRRERPGRNEPCWCGSAKKYKRCHLEEDARNDRDPESLDA